MACTYYTDSELRDIASVQADKLKKELDEATALLCSAMRQIEGMGDWRGNFQPSETHLLWWKKHKEMDAKRIKEEERLTKEAKAYKKKITKTRKIKKAALKKLTEEEKEVLGLED